MPQSLHFFTLLPILSALFTLYITFIQVTTIRPQHQPQISNSVKKIVAYSLEKQIQVDSEEVFCENTDRWWKANKEISANQWRNIKNTNLYVYSVHFDRRLQPYNFLRIISVVKGKWNASLYCQILTTDGRYRVLKANVHSIWAQQWDAVSNYSYYVPVLVSCRVPDGEEIDKITLTRHACKQSRDYFAIAERNVMGKRRFTVCVKPLDFLEDISSRLVAWIEMNRVLGADKLDIYVKRVPDNVYSLLKWYNYTSDGFVHVKMFEYPKGAAGDDLERVIWQKRRLEIAAYNDCFYRNQERSDYVVPLDIDEIIVPRNANSWQQLFNTSVLNDLEGQYASFTVPNAYYLRAFTSNRTETREKRREPVLFFSDVTRSELSAQGESGKSFISTKNTLTVFNHYAMDVLRPGVRKCYFFSSQLVQMNHYKATCPIVILPECSKYLSSPVRVVDTVIFRFKARFMEVYKKILRRLRRLGVVKL